MVNYVKVDLEAQTMCRLGDRSLFKCQGGGGLNSRGGGHFRVFFKVNVQNWDLFWGC